MSEKIKVEFEIDIEQALSIVLSKQPGTKQLSPEELQELKRKGVIRASDYLSKPEEYVAATVFTKMRQFPDHVPEFVHRFEAIEKFKAVFKWDPAMFHASAPGGLGGDPELRKG